MSWMVSFINAKQLVKGCTGIIDRVAAIRFISQKTAEGANCMMVLVDDDVTVVDPFIASMTQAELPSDPVPSLAYRQVMLLRQYRKMLRNLARLIAVPQVPDFIRTSGNAECPLCLLPLVEHPLSADGILVVTCDGTLVKL